VGPAPEITAGIPSARSRSTSAALSGIAGARYSWCSRSSVAGSSSSGRLVRASTSSAARPALAAASTCGTAAREQSSGGLGEDRLRRYENHRNDGIGGFHPDRPRGSALHPGQRETAEQTGRDVVGVALDLGGELQERLVVELAVAAYGHGARGDDAGADGGRGGTEAAAVRDAVGADDLEAARLSAEQVEGGAQGTYEQVVLVAREGLAALAGDVDEQPGVGHPDDHVVVEPQRQAEGVEARAEVGAGGGDAHPDGGGAERWTGHRSMTLLELRDCRNILRDIRRYGRPRAAGTARRGMPRHMRRAGSVQPIEGRFCGDIGRTGGARCVS
jgi:hypothetical protein